MRCRRVHQAGVGLWLLAGVGLGACSNLDPVATYDQETDPAKLYFQLALDHRAINMSTVAPYDTFRLVATPQNAGGEPMVGLPAPTFRLVNASDSTRVSVTPDGLLKARGTANRIQVIAELGVEGNVRHADTAQVTVKTTVPPKLASLSFDPVPPDSAKQSIVQNLGKFNLGSFTALNVLFGLNIYNPRPYAPHILDSTGNAITGLLIEYRSLDPSVAALADNSRIVAGATKIYGLRPGQTRIVASTTAYGITRSDTVLFTITWPVLQAILIQPGLGGAPPQFVPSDIHLAPNGIVYWQSFVDDSVDVTFDDTTNVARPLSDLCDALDSEPQTYGSGPDCGTGDMLVPAAPVDSLGKLLPAMTDRVRQFPVPGVYRFHSTRTGATGQVVVTADPDPTALP